MIAAPSLSSSSTASSHLIRDRALRLSSSFPSTRTAWSCPPPRFSASCASAAERERDGTGGSSYYYGYSRSCSGGGVAAAADGDAAAGTLYDVLGLAAGATAQEIKAAYRRLARACHPDAAVAGREGASADEFMRVHAAYATLSDPDKRAEYDRRVVASAPPRRPPFRWSFSSASHYSPPSAASCSTSSSSSGFPRRTWETDQCW